MLECAGAICRNCRCRQRLFRGGGVGDHAIVQRLPPPVLEILVVRSYRAPLRAHDIVGGCAHSAAQKGEEIMGGTRIVERSDQGLNKACGAVHGADVGPTLEHMG